MKGPIYSTKGGASNVIYILKFVVGILCQSSHITAILAGALVSMHVNITELKKYKHEQMNAQVDIAISTWGNLLN